MIPNGSFGGVLDDSYVGLELGAAAGISNEGLIVSTLNKSSAGILIVADGIIVGVSVASTVAVGSNVGLIVLVAVIVGIVVRMKVDVGSTVTSVA